jgi:Leucine-rich repeat (LRR) protein|tara:strand:- start:1408 stop:2397 length:990 start_codon:yes stop_codon:yes gene_type:complete
MKKLLLLLIFPVIGFSQHTTIPDKAFEETLINLGYDTVLDGKVLTANIIGVKRLEFNALQNQSHLSISDFTGIHNFKALEELSIKFLNLESIDLSNNKELIYLNIEGCKLTSLDLSNHPSLTYLDCESNQLTNLDLSSNKALTQLSCSGNELTNLDLSNNKALTHLNCKSNQLKNLNLSNNKVLIYLSCRDNELTDLDLSNNISLAQLYCDRAQLNSLNLGNNFVEINNLTEENRLKKEKEKRNEILFYILVFLIVFVFLAAVWYLMKPKCPECKKKVFKKSEVLSSLYTDTTPQKKGGGRDKRYNQRGYWSKLKKWTCNCGYSWQKWV